MRFFSGFRIVWIGMFNFGLDRKIPNIQGIEIGICKYRKILTVNSRKCHDHGDRERDFKVQDKSPIGIFSEFPGNPRDSRFFVISAVLSPAFFPDFFIFWIIRRFFIPGIGIFRGFHMSLVWHF